MSPTRRAWVLALIAALIGFVTVAFVGSSVRFLWVAAQHGGL